MTETGDHGVDLFLKQEEIALMVEEHAKEALDGLPDNLEAHRKQRQVIQEQIGHYLRLVNILTEIQEKDIEEYGE